jgi:hypothetical protein
VAHRGRLTASAPVREGVIYSRRALHRHGRADQARHDTPARTAVTPSTHQPAAGWLDDYAHRFPSQKSPRHPLQQDGLRPPTHLWAGGERERAPRGAPPHALRVSLEVFSGPPFPPPPGPDGAPQPYPSPEVEHDARIDRQPQHRYARGRAGTADSTGFLRAACSKRLWGNGTQAGREMLQFDHQRCRRQPGTANVRAAS